MSQIRSVDGSPKVEPQVIKNSYSSETASPRVTPNVVINPEFQASAKQHNTNDKERNDVVEAQKTVLITSNSRCTTTRREFSLSET